MPKAESPSVDGSVSEQLEAIKARVDEATPGPWNPYCETCEGDGWYADHDDECRETGDCVCTGVQRECEACEGTGYQGRALTAADTLFIAHAREDVPYLLSVVDALTRSAPQGATPELACCAAARRETDTRAEVDRQLGRHLCYMSPDSRERFWRAVDEALAVPAEEGAEAIVEWDGGLDAAFAVCRFIRMAAEEGAAG